MGVKRKYLRAGLVQDVLVSPDETGRYCVALLVAVAGDPGRDYWIHLTTDDVTRIGDVAANGASEQDA